jgi:hypothetical protein
VEADVARVLPYSPLEWHETGVRAWKKRARKRNDQGKREKKFVHMITLQIHLLGESDGGGFPSPMDAM